MCRPWAAASVAVALLSGCSGTIFEPFDVDDQSLSLDARQRLVLSARRGAQPVTRTAAGETVTGRRIVCAEPSPDVAATLAANLGANLTLAGLPQLPGTVDAAARAQSAEQLAYIGARNATIQLLRDGLYRACEAYMNGALGDFGYGLILVNYGKLMVATLAAEGLVRPGLVPPVIIGSTTGSDDLKRTIETGGTTPETASGGNAAASQQAAVTPAAAAQGQGGTSKVDTDQKTGAGAAVVQIGNVTNASAATVNDNVERIFKEVIYNLSNPLADGSGTAKATEIVVACMLAVDEGGVRPAAMAPGSVLGRMCKNVLDGTPATIGKIMERQGQLLEAEVRKKEAEARVIEAQAQQASGRVREAESRGRAAGRRQDLASR